MGVISREKRIPVRAVWAVRGERHASPCCASSERPFGLSLPSHSRSPQKVQGKPDKRVGESERDREQRLNIVHIGVLHTGSKPWAGAQTLQQSGLGCHRDPKVGDVAVSCCCGCDSIKDSNGKKPRASLLLSQLGKGLLYLPFGVR